MLAKFVVRSHRKHHPSAAKDDTETVPQITPGNVEKIPQVKFKIYIISK